MLIGFTGTQTLLSKYCMQLKWVCNQIMSCCAAVGWRLQGEMNRKINVKGGEEGFLWVLYYQSPPYNNVRLLYKVQNPNHPHTGKHTPNCVPNVPKPIVFAINHWSLLHCLRSLLEIKGSFGVRWCCGDRVIVSTAEDVVRVKSKSPIHLYGFS